MEDQSSENLARNVQSLRRRRGLSQNRVAQLSGIPRSTIAHIESGQGNPSLHNLARLSAALGVSIEELLARPRSEFLLIPAARVPVKVRAGGLARLFDLLPEHVRGLEIGRLELDPGATFRGTPHLAGTKEYLHALEGRISVLVAGETHALQPGDVFAFPGDQPHSYINRSAQRALAVSIVIPLPLAGALAAPQKSPQKSL